MSNNLEQSAEQFLLLMGKIRQLGPQTAPPVAAKISPSQLALMIFIALTPGCGVQAIASGLKLSKATVSIGVNQLEESGFIVRQPDPNDGRAVQLFLTTKGEELHKRTHEFQCKKFKFLLAGLAPEERIALISLLEKALLTIEKKEQEQKK